MDPIRIPFVLFSVLGLGCTEESSSEDEALRDRGILIDANIDAFIIDARPREVEDTGTDAGVEAAVCFKDEGALMVLSTLDVEPGAEKLITRFHLNGDSVPEMIVRSKDSAAFTFTVYEGLELNVLGAFTVPGDRGWIFKEERSTGPSDHGPFHTQPDQLLYTVQKGEAETVVQFTILKTTLR